MIRPAYAAVSAFVLISAASPVFAQRGPGSEPRPRPQGIDRRVEPRGGTEVTEPFSRTIRLGRNGTFDISNLAGAIVITGGGGNDVSISAVKRTRAENADEGRARLRTLEIQVSESNNRVEVRTEHPRGQRVSGVVDYTVTLPQDTSVVARSVSGDIRLTNVRGDLRVETVSGDIESSGARKLSTVRSVSGDIVITDGEAPDLVSLRTVSGDQTVSGLKARAVDVNSVSGYVRFDNTSITRGDFKTVSGDVEFNGQLAANGRYQATSHSGDIRLSIADIGFEVEASTFSGDFRSDYAVVLRGSDDTGPGGRRARPNRNVRGTYGNGSAILDLRTFSGNIVVGKR